MVRHALMPTARRGRALLAGMVAVILLNLGCVGTDKRTWFSSKPEPPPPASHMGVIYYKHVRYIPDPTRGGAPTPALALRMYLFKGKDDGEPILGDGTVTVDLYDNATPAGRNGTLPKETTKFPKEMLPKLLQKDEMGGQGGYTLLIPCPPDVMQVHITVRFEQAGHAPLFASSDSMTLDRGAPPPALAQPVAGTTTN